MDKSNNLEILSIEKSYEQRLNEVKTNITKMIVNRNFINRENQDKHINELIKTNKEDFIISLDNDSNYNTVITDKKIYIKIFNYKIISTTKGTEIIDFLMKNLDKYKILIVEDIDKKSERFIKENFSLFEIFKFSELQINLVDHVLVSPHYCLSQEKAEKVKEVYNMQKKDMPYMLETDPMAKYYSMKNGDICEIIRPSLTSGNSFNYRLVIKPKI